MSEREILPKRSTAELIDRMVDGAMSPAELRQAVEQLDASPGSWRLCVAAFLEAQCWRETFREIGAVGVDETVQVPALIASDSIAPPVTPPRRWGGIALAASIALVAFSMGWLGHRLSARDRSLQSPGAPVLAVAKTAEDTETRSSPQPLAPGEIAGLPTVRLPTVREVARLRIGNGEATSAEVPILAGPGVSSRWLQEQPMPVSEHEKALWQRQGYELEQTRRFMSVPLADGRRAAVPVDQVRLRYVGREPL